MDRQPLSTQERNELADALEATAQVLRDPLAHNGEIKAAIARVGQQMRKVGEATQARIDAGMYDKDT